MQRVEAGPSSATYVVRDAGSPARSESKTMPQKYDPKDFRSISLTESDESRSRNMPYSLAFMQAVDSGGAPNYWEIIHEPEELEEGVIPALGESSTNGPSAFLTLSIVSLRAQHLLEEQQRVHEQADTHSSSTPHAINDTSFTSSTPAAPNQLELTKTAGAGLIKEEDRNLMIANEESKKSARARSRPIMERLHVLSKPISFCRELKQKTSEVLGSHSFSRGTAGECTACLEHFTKPRLVDLACHKYCKMCFEKLVNVSLESEDQWPVKCCAEAIPSRTILRHIGRNERKRFHQRELEWSTPPAKRIYCVVTECGAFIPLTAISKNKTCAKCLKCKRKVCTQCRGAWHGIDDCPEESGLQETLTFAESQGWRRCHRCRAMIARIDGCRRVYCRCRAVFCYLCGKGLRACGCADSDDWGRGSYQPGQLQAESSHSNKENSVEHQVAVESQDDERARLVAAAFRQRIINTEVAATAAKFEQAREQLEAVHATQKRLIAHRWHSQEEQLRRDRQDMLDKVKAYMEGSMNFWAKEAEDIERLKALNQKSLLLEEPEARSNRVMKTMKLQRGNPTLQSDFDEEMEESTKAIRERQESQVEVQNQGIENLAMGLRERINRIKESQEEALRTVHLTFKQYKRGLQTIKFAESHWMAAVIAERQSMLRMMEADEIARVREDF
ncbi:hypothetical protein ACMFMG_002762 [Clarireedia jacksonii]